MSIEKKTIYVIGHKNPDTDSICSAIAYAELKRRLTGEKYKAKRAGQINAETEFVLNRFNSSVPGYVSDVRPQVRDIEVREGTAVKSGISLKAAWTHMVENNVVTLPIITDEYELEGLITIGDIAKTYMDVYDSTILAMAKTSYRNIVETLEGELVTGDLNGDVTKGKVLIAAANPDLLETYIDTGDVVILGNRYETQLCALEMNASCLVVCDGAPVSITITNIAKSKGSTIIRTPYDTFTVARLINQSMPIRYFMRSKDLITFTTDDYIEEIRDVMATKRHRDFPILDRQGSFRGMISRRNLLGAKKKRLILMDHNESSQAIDGIEEADILEIIDHHRLGGIETINPVYFRNQPLGCTSTIVYLMYGEYGEEIPEDIAGLLCSAILSDTLMFRSPTCTPLDKSAAMSLAEKAGIADIEHYAKEMFSAGSNLLGKSAEEIFYQDFKKFTAGEIVFGVGQICSMDSDELDKIKEKLIPYMKKALEDHRMSMIFFMLTDILEEETELLYMEEGARSIVEQAFPTSRGENKITLRGVVSRKKQLIPAIMSTLQQEGNETY